MLPNEATEDVVDGFMDAWTCVLLVYIVPPLGAYKSQLGGHIYIFAVVLYGHCLLWLYVYIYIYITDYNCIHSSCQFFGVFLHVRCIPQQNSQWQFFASVCVCVWLCVCVSVCVYRLCKRKTSRLIFVVHLDSVLVLILSRIYSNSRGCRRHWWDRH